MRCLAKTEDPPRRLCFIQAWRPSMRYPEKLTVHPVEKIAVPRTLSSILGLFVVLLLASPGLALSETRAVSATIDVSKTGAPISKNIYGQFLEHGGDIVNNGVWSEMLVDRKFFYPVAATAPTPPPVIGGAGGNPRFRRTPTRWWAPIGSGNAVIMDTRTPTPATNLRWSILTSRTRTASANPESPFEKGRPTSDESCSQVLPARS